MQINFFLAIVFEINRIAVFLVIVSVGGDHCMSKYLPADTFETLSFSGDEE